VGPPQRGDGGAEQGTRALASPPATPDFAELAASRVRPSLNRARKSAGNAGFRGACGVAGLGLAGHVRLNLAPRLAQAVIVRLVSVSVGKPAGICQP